VIALVVAGLAVTALFVICLAGTGARRKVLLNPHGHFLSDMCFAAVYQSCKAHKVLSQSGGLAPLAAI